MGNRPSDIRFTLNISLAKLPSTFSEYLLTEAKFSPVLLYDQAFSRYKVVDNLKSTH